MSINEPRRSLAQATVDRTLKERYSAAEEEVARLIEATFTVFAATGTLDPPVREILSEAGLSTQAFYRHFRSKEELMLVVADEGNRILLGYLIHRMEKAAGPLEQVQAWIEGILAQAKDERSRARTRPWSATHHRLAADSPEHIAAASAQLTAILAAAIEEARDAGLAHTPDPSGDAQLIRECVFNTMWRSVFLEQAVDNADVERVVDFAFRALGIHRAAAPTDRPPRGGRK